MSEGRMREIRLPFPRLVRLSSKWEFIFSAIVYLEVYGTGNPQHNKKDLLKNSKGHIKVKKGNSQLIEKVLSEIKVKNEIEDFLKRKSTLKKLAPKEN